MATSQTTALVLVALLIAVRGRPPSRLDTGTASLAAGAGLLSLLATGLYFLAAHAGLLTVAAVLASLYPGVTVLLAATVLRERPDRRQVAGLATGAVAVVLIVTGS